MLSSGEVSLAQEPKHRLEKRKAEAGVQVRRLQPARLGGGARKETGGLHTSPCDEVGW